MKIYIYDIEVFSNDWIVVFRNPEFTDNHVIIHNDNYHLREFLAQDDIVIGGFNNKHYDDWIVLTMLLGGSNVEVKKHNDFIIGGSNGWEFPFIQYQKKPFRSFDTRDDIADKGLSLKAIEGNMNLPVVESSVPFDIDRALTPEEYEEVVRYCKNDLDATVALYQAREEYFKSKIIVADMYGLDPAEALGLTNAKLATRVLNAKLVERSDERDYVLPECLDESMIPPEVMSFFMQIRDESIPETKLFGTGKEGSKGMTLDIIYETSSGLCPVTYAWGGVHGAKPAYTIEASEDRLIVNYDVSSLYPNSMINFGCCSRSMEHPDAYKKLVKTRLEAKKAGDKEKAGALKLVVNTVYGAMLNPYNDLADRRSGRSVCISNQLAVTQLIVMLGRRCSSIDFININTDGLMFLIDKSEDKKSQAVIAEWSDITGFETERTDFKKVIQKDVNNYVGITSDGSLKTKGSYVSLYKGGDFKTNSLQIIHKAVVEYLVNGTSPEETIRNEPDIFKFQNIVKTGSTYDGVYHYINEELTPIQKVNRIYAVKNKIYGQVVKRKWLTEKRKKDKETGKMISVPVEPHYEYTTIPECPKHTFIDNENTLSVKDLDLDYYIRMAKDRINKYVNLDPKVKRRIEKIKEVITIMANEKETVKTADLNVYQKLAAARMKFLESSVKKTGKNRFAEFKYFELSDIVPVATEIFNELGLILLIDLERYERGTVVVGRLVNTDNPDDWFSLSAAVDGELKTNSGEYPNGMNSIQALGGTMTYLRRYMYYLILDVVECDLFDAIQKPSDGDEEGTTSKSKRPATPTERAEAKKELIDEDGSASETQIKAIKNGLKKLREKDAERYDKFIRGQMIAIKNGISKADAEDRLISIGTKIEEE